MMTEEIADMQASANPAFSNNPLSSWWILAVITVGVIYPRFVLLGDFPHMDEGLFVFLANQSRHALAAGTPLPTMHGLTLEGALLAWTGYLPGNPAFWLRLWDIVPASIAGWILCLIYRQESGSSLTGYLIALIVICPMNYSGVIDAGYKNQLPVAFCLLFSAYYLVQNPVKVKETWRWFVCGILIALAVLFREPFIAFALYGIFAIWLGYGFKRAFWYGLGGVLIAISTLIALFHYQGGVSGIIEIIEAYAGRGAVYGSSTDRIIHNFYSGIYKSLLNFEGPLILCLSSALLLLFARLKSKKYVLSSHKRHIFWLCATLLPLLEPISKIGFLYHFAICLPALGGLCAFYICNAEKSLHTLSNRTRHRARLAWRSAMVVCCIISIIGLPNPCKMEMTIAMLRHLPNAGWPDAYTEKSNILIAAKEIKRLLPPGGSLATSGFSFFLYEAANAWPPDSGWFHPDDKYHLSDMSRSMMLLHEKIDTFAMALRKNPPDVLAIGKARDAHEEDYAEKLQEAVQKTGMYSLAAVIPANNELNYGWMEYYIYTRKNPK